MGNSRGSVLLFSPWICLCFFPSSKPDWKHSHGGHGGHAGAPGWHWRPTWPWTSPTRSGSHPGCESWQNLADFDSGRISLSIIKPCVIHFQILLCQEWIDMEQSPMEGIGHESMSMWYILRAKHNPDGPGTPSKITGKRPIYGVTRIVVSLSRIVCAKIVLCRKQTQATNSWQICSHLSSTLHLRCLCPPFLVRSPLTKIATGVHATPQSSPVHVLYYPPVKINHPILIQFPLRISQTFPFTLIFIIFTFIKTGWNTIDHVENLSSPSGQALHHHFVDLRLLGHLSGEDPWTTAMGNIY